MSKALIMTFSTTGGEKASLKVDPVNPHVSDGDVAELMALIASKKIFISKSGYLEKPQGAQLVERAVSKLHIK